MELNNSVAEYISKALEAGQHEQESFWSTLTKEQQLMAFCHVIRQVTRAEEVFPKVVTTVNIDF